MAVFLPTPREGSPFATLLRGSVSWEVTLPSSSPISGPTLATCLTTTKSAVTFSCRWRQSVGKFAEKTDVWAFGVTIWELFTLAKEVPYPQLSDKEVIQNSLKRECRKFPPKPTECPKPMFEMMERCWCLEVKQRATFTELDQTLQDILK